MKYPYFRGLEADRYSFYRVPKALIKVDLFEKDVWRCKAALCSLAGSDESLA